MAFHVANHICVERLVDGGVRIFKRELTGVVNGFRQTRPKEMLVEMTASEWASVMASVSRRGSETSRLHQEALDFHERVE